jgi:hypothetical protein
MRVCRYSDDRLSHVDRVGAGGIAPVPRAQKRCVVEVV